MPDSGSKLPQVLYTPVCASGQWVGPGGWAYHQEIGWMHCFMLWQNQKPAEWHGPPPPRLPVIPLDWGKITPQVAVSPSMDRT